MQLMEKGQTFFPIFAYYYMMKAARDCNYVLVFKDEFSGFVYRTLKFQAESDSKSPEYDRLVCLFRSLSAQGVRQTEAV